MKNRCYNPNFIQFKDYGGRGITVCDEWVNKEKVNTGKTLATKGWLAFQKWALSHGYRDDLSIDRIDYNKGYSPENCRWSCRKVQNNNKRDNHLVTYKGKTQTIAQWCEELKLPYHTIATRIKAYHFTPEQAFEIKENAHLRMITYKGRTQSLKAWCKELGLKYKTIHDRINAQHWTIERAFETKTKA